MSHSTRAAGVRQLRSVIAAQRHRDESDEQLLHAFADCRDDTAFAVLVRRHGPLVMGVCRRLVRVGRPVTPSPDKHRRLIPTQVCQENHERLTGEGRHTRNCHSS
ncbi:MAG TPA: hypothetical protein VH682_25205 [Gemmataceae bacterium]